MGWDRPAGLWLHNQVNAISSTSTWLPQKKYTQRRPSRALKQEGVAVCASNAYALTHADEPNVSIQQNHQLVIMHALDQIRRLKSIDLFDAKIACCIVWLAPDSHR